MTDYSSYQHLLIEKADGIMTLTMNRPESLNSANFRLHNELSRIWLDIAADPEVRVAVVTGAGDAFSAGGDFEMIEQAIDNPAIIAQNTQEASDIVYNILNLDKPIISAINGVAVGAGLAGCADGRHLHCRRRRPHYRRPYPAGRCGGRPRGNHLAPAVRNGQGQVLPADLRVSGWQGGGANRPGQHVRAADRADGNCHADRPATGRRPAASYPLYQEGIEPVAADRRVTRPSIIHCSLKLWVSSATT